MNHHKPAPNHQPKCPMLDGSAYHRLQVDLAALGQARPDQYRVNIDAII